MSPDPGGVDLTPKGPTPPLGRWRNLGEIRLKYRRPQYLI